MADDDWHEIKGDIAAAHARLDAQAGEISDIKTSMRSMDAKLDKILAREPSRLPFWALGGVLGVLLTILALVVTPLYSALDNGATAFSERISRSDVKHNADHAEQEQDIEQLREHDAELAHNIDRLQVGHAQLETLAEERTARFQQRILDRASDRWTGSQQRVFESGLKTYHESLERRVTRLEEAREKGQ